MTWMNRHLLGGALIAALLLFTGCRRHTVVHEDGTVVTHVHRPLRGDVTLVHPATQSQADPVVESDQAPPEIIVETRPAAPSVHHVWVPGYWAWRSGHYIWVKGVHVLPPRGQTAWVSGHYVRAGLRWRWIPGHWR